jgi:hypothetical protein
MEISYMGLHDKTFRFSCPPLKARVIVKFLEEGGGYGIAVYFDGVLMLMATSTRVVYSDDAFRLIEIAAGDPDALTPDGIVIPEIEDPKL